MRYCNRYRTEYREVGFNKFSEIHICRDCSFSECNRTDGKPPDGEVDIYDLPLCRLFHTFQNEDNSLLASAIIEKLEGVIQRSIKLPPPYPSIAEMSKNVYLAVCASARDYKITD